MQTDGGRLFPNPPRPAAFPPYYVAFFHPPNLTLPAPTQNIKKDEDKKHGLLIIFPLKRSYLPDLGTIGLATRKKKKEGRTSAKSAVDASFLDYTDHDSDKAEMMTDAAVISKPLRKIGGIFQT